MNLLFIQFQQWQSIEIYISMYYKQQLMYYSTNLQGDYLGPMNHCSITTQQMVSTSTITTVLDHIHRCLISNLLRNSKRKLRKYALSVTAERSINNVFMTITPLEMRMLPKLPLPPMTYTALLRPRWVSLSYCCHHIFLKLPPVNLYLCHYCTAFTIIL